MNDVINHVRAIEDRWLKSGHQMPERMKQDFTELCMHVRTLDFKCRQIEKLYLDHLEKLKAELKLISKLVVHESRKDKPLDK